MKGEIFVRCEAREFNGLDGFVYGSVHGDCTENPWLLRILEQGIALHLPTGEVWVDTGMTAYRWDFADDADRQAGERWTTPASMLARNMVNPNLLWGPVAWGEWQLCQ